MEPLWSYTVKVSRRIIAKKKINARPMISSSIKCQQPLSRYATLLKHFSQFLAVKLNVSCTVIVKYIVNNCVSLSLQRIQPEAVLIAVARGSRPQAEVCPNPQTKFLLSVTGHQDNKFSGDWLGLRRPVALHCPSKWRQNRQ